MSNSWQSLLCVMIAPLALGSMDWNSKALGQEPQQCTALDGDTVQEIIQRSGCTHLKIPLIGSRKVTDPNCSCLLSIMLMRPHNQPIETQLKWTNATKELSVTTVSNNGVHYPIWRQHGAVIHDNILEVADLPLLITALQEVIDNQAVERLQTAPNSKEPPQAGADEGSFTQSQVQSGAKKNNEDGDPTQTGEDAQNGAPPQNGAANNGEAPIDRKKGIDNQPNDGVLLEFDKEDSPAGDGDVAKQKMSESEGSDDVIGVITFLLLLISGVGLFVSHHGRQRVVTMLESLRGLTLEPLNKWKAEIFDAGAKADGRTERRSPSRVESPELQDLKLRVGELAEAVEVEHSARMAAELDFSQVKVENINLLKWARLSLVESNFSEIEAEVVLLGARYGELDSDIYLSFLNEMREFEDLVDSRADTYLVAQKLGDVGVYLFDYLHYFGPKGRNVARLVEGISDAIASIDSMNIRVDVPSIGSQAIVQEMKVQGDGGKITRVKSWGVRENGHLLLKAKVDTS